jgi:hypothetical protein
MLGTCVLLATRLELNDCRVGFPQQGSVVLQAQLERVSSCVGLHHTQDVFGRRLNKPNRLLKLASSISDLFSHGFEAGDDAIQLGEAGELVIATSTSTARLMLIFATERARDRPTNLGYNDLRIDLLFRRARLPPTLLKSLGHTRPLPSVTTNHQSLPTVTDSPRPVRQTPTTPHTFPSSGLLLTGIEDEHDGGVEREDVRG